MYAIMSGRHRDAKHVTSNDFSSRLWLLSTENSCNAHTDAHFLKTSLGVRSYLLHGSGLGSRAYSGHRQTHIDSWADTLVEQLSLQEDLQQTDENSQYKSFVIQDVFMNTIKEHLK